TRRGRFREPVMTLVKKCLAGILGIGCLAGLLALRSFMPAAERARSIPDFTLQDTLGRRVSLADYRESKAVAGLFVGTECPLANKYLLSLAEMQREYGPRGLQVLAVNSNVQDSAEAIARHARERDLPYPVLIDAERKVADLLGAQRTPSVFLLDAAGVVRYSGRIDDRYGVGGGDRGTPRREDLREAIEDVLAGRAVRVPTTEPLGCIIPRVKA